MPSSCESPPAHVLVFDLDDTLYLERDFACSGFTAVETHLSDKYGNRVTHGTCWGLFVEGARGKIFDLALESFGIEATPSLLDELVQVYRSHPPQIRLCPDACRFLASDRRRRAIITDGPADMQRSKIAALGIEESFDCIIPTGELAKGMGKPHPMAFEQIMQWSGELGEMHVYIADNPAKDFIAPRALDWRTVQIDRVGRIHSPDATSSEQGAELRINTFDDLSKAIELTH